MADFRTISSIRVDGETTWRDALFLPFDIDWAHDDVSNDIIYMIEEAEATIVGGSPARKIGTVVGEGEQVRMVFDSRD